MLTSTEPFMLTTTSGFAPFSENQEVIQGTTKANGTILRMNPDGSGREVYAWGLRNPYGVAWGPTVVSTLPKTAFDARGSRPTPMPRIPSGRSARAAGTAGRTTPPAFR